MYGLFGKNSLHNCTCTHFSEPSEEHAITFSKHFSQVDLNAYGIDWDGPGPSEEWDGRVEDDTAPVQVPETIFPLESQGLQELSRQVDPAEHSMYYGVDIYLNALSFMQQWRNI